MICSKCCHCSVARDAINKALFRESPSRNRFRVHHPENVTSEGQSQNWCAGVDELGRGVRTEVGDGSSALTTAGSYDVIAVRRRDGVLFAVDNRSGGEITELPHRDNIHEVTRW